VNPLRWSWIWVVLVSVAWVPCAGAATYWWIVYSYSLNSFYTPFTSMSRVPPAMFGVIWGPPLVLFVARAWLGRSSKRVLAVVTVTVFLLTAFLFRPLINAWFMAWWTGKSSAHYWP